MCKRRKPEAINILSFNVEGLKPKLGDSNFIGFMLRFLQKHGRQIHQKLTLRGTGTTPK